MSDQKVIKSFHDLLVYQNLYKPMIIVHKEIIPKLPETEKYDLQDQLRRASKAAPALIAEGFAKRYQKRQWRKYIDDCIGEGNEMVHHISVCIDLYSEKVDVKICNYLINKYDISCRQATNLKKSWQNFHDNK